MLQGEHVQNRELLVFPPKPTPLQSIPSHQTHHSGMAAQTSNHSFDLMDKSYGACPSMHIPNSPAPRRLPAPITPASRGDHGGASPPFNLLPPSSLHSALHTTARGILLDVVHLLSFPTANAPMGVHHASREIQAPFVA